MSVSGLESHVPLSSPSKLVVARPVESARPQPPRLSCRAARARVESLILKTDWTRRTDRGRDHAA